MPINTDYTRDEVVLLTPDIAKKYAAVNSITVTRDLKELQDMGLLVRNRKKYRANSDVLRNMMAVKKLNG